MNPRVLIDARKLGEGGIGIYISNLIDGLLEHEDYRSGRWGLGLLVPPMERLRGSVRADDAAAQLGKWDSYATIYEEPAGSYSFAEMLLLAYRQRSALQEHCLYHTPHYTLPFGLKMPSVVTIHDVIHLSHPDTALHRVVGGMLIKSATKRASHVLTVSNASRLALERFSGPLSTPCSVIYNGLRSSIKRASVERVAAVRAALGLSPSFALFVGSDRPHKGFSELLESWPLIERECRERRLKPLDLVVVGNRYSSKSKARALRVMSGASVHFVGKVSDERLCALYSAASVVAIPSREEGFGLVALEAMACGAPVVCYPLESLREVCDKAATYVALGGAEALAHAICSVLVSTEETEKRTRLGQQRAMLFSSVEGAAKTQEIYRSLIEGEIRSGKLRAKAV